MEFAPPPRASRATQEKVRGSGRGSGASPPPRTSGIGGGSGAASASSAARRSVRAASPTSTMPSPSAQRLAMTTLDHQSIIALSQTCTEDLDVKLREKNALTKLLNELKKKKMQYDAKHAKKKREADSTIVQTLDMEKKLSALNSSLRMITAELTGTRSENERLDMEVDTLRKDYREASSSFERECMEVEKLKKMLLEYRKEINQEAKMKDSVQQDLRASRTAQNLMINRLDDMEKRNRALKMCVANAVNG